MKTYQDMQAAIAPGGEGLEKFVTAAISEYVGSSEYRDIEVAYDYFCKKNRTIMQFQKWLQTLDRGPIPDLLSSNYKFRNAFFRVIVEQEASYLLGEGITFNSPDTKKALGGDQFDARMREACEYALWGRCSYVFYNLDRIEVFKPLEFVPLYDEETGALRAGIRFWQIDSKHNKRITLYQEDGYTDYIDVPGKDLEIRDPKRTYRVIVSRSQADGVTVSDGGNYVGFPIVPLWGNRTHTSELEGLREKIDGYDMIQSGLANTIDDASELYWIIQNGSGMDDPDIARFFERLRSLRAAVTDGPEQVTPHTIEIPFEARRYALENLRESIFRDAMALDMDKLSAGNATATAIKASYENLDLKCDGLEMCVTDTVKSLLILAGKPDDMPTYKRSKLINEQEQTAMVLSAKDYLDEETILKHLPFLSPDEIKDILKRKAAEREAAKQSETPDASAYSADGSDRLVQPGESNSPSDGESDG